MRSRQPTCTLLLQRTTGMHLRRLVVEGSPVSLGRQHAVHPAAGPLRMSMPRARFQRPYVFVQVIRGARAVEPGSHGADGVWPDLDFADAVENGTTRCARHAVTGEVIFRLRHVRALEAAHLVERLGVCAGGDIGSPFDCSALDRCADRCLHHESGDGSIFVSTADILISAIAASVCEGDNETRA